MRLQLLCQVLLGMVFAGMSIQAHAQLYKCQLGMQILYQNQPCPSGSERLPMSAPDPAPDPAAVKEARKQAREEMKRASALRKEEAREDAAEEKATRQQQAEDNKQQKACLRLRDSIEARKAIIGKDGKPAAETAQARKERLRYQRECGPL